MALRVRIRERQFMPPSGYLESGTSRVVQKGFCHVTGLQKTEDTPITLWPHRRRVHNARVISYLRRFPNRSREEAVQYAKGMDLGGKFDTISHDFSNSHNDVEFLVRKGNLNFQRYYNGPLFAGIAMPVTAKEATWPKLPAQDENLLRSVGTTMLAQSLPTNPLADASVTLVELYREGLPAILGLNYWKSRHKPHKGLSDEYLNYQFGIKPLVSDLRAIHDVSSKAAKLIEQYERDSGRMIRRRRESEPIVSTTEVVGTGRVTPSQLDAYCWDVSQGKLTTTTVSTDRFVFSGSFTYYLDTGSDLRSRIKRDAQIARKLYGFSASADTAWNLMPWSWAIDWFANGGDVMRNLSAFQSDGLVMYWGYIQRETKLEVTRTLEGIRPYQGTTLPPIVTKLTQYRKTRRKAHPFGFGVTDTSLTARQIAIMTALGISRASS